VTAVGVAAMQIVPRKTIGARARQSKVKTKIAMETNGRGLRTSIRLPIRRGRLRSDLRQTKVRRTRLRRNKMSQIQKASLPLNRF